MASQRPSQPTALAHYLMIGEKLHDLFTGRHNFRGLFPKATEPAESIPGIGGYLCGWLKPLNFRQGLKSGCDFALFC
jgi:hypothetical protein